MPRDLRWERSARMALDSQVTERQRVQKWGSRPSRIRRGLSEATKIKLYGAGTLILLALIGAMWGWGGRQWP